MLFSETIHQINPDYLLSLRNLTAHGGNLTAHSKYFSDKFSEWGLQNFNKTGTWDYRPYIRSIGKDKLAQEFKNDERFKEDVCSYLKTYGKGKEKESIFSIIESIGDPDTDVIEILVGATLDACGYSDIGNKLIGLAIIGLISFALISLVAKK